jgi:hypothetical protein
MLAALTGWAVKDRHECRDKMASLTLHAAAVIASPSCTGYPSNVMDFLEIVANYGSQPYYDAIAFTEESHA